LALKVVFDKLVPVHKLCKKSFMMTEQCISSKKKLTFVMQNLGIWGLMETGVSYLESTTLICLFTMQLLWGHADD